MNRRFRFTLTETNRSYLVEAKSAFEAAVTALQHLGLRYAETRFTVRPA